MPQNYNLESRSVTPTCIALSKRYSSLYTQGIAEQVKSGKKKCPFVEQGSFKVDAEPDKMAEEIATAKALLCMVCALCKVQTEDYDYLIEYA